MYADHVSGFWGDGVNMAAKTSREVEESVSPSCMARASACAVRMVQLVVVVMMAFVHGPRRRTGGLSWWSDAISCFISSLHN